ncbi:MAG: hypothetical protein F4W92_08590 [Gammaproteobacteria bacterium]|nr:hypothetical protein [Gammaproteobacteria bacterium]
MISLQDVVNDLYRIVIREGKKTSKKRLDLLARMCEEQLALRGIDNVETETSIPGFGREKEWDVSWSVAGKIRLGISLKSLLSNISGTVPNRIDDFMGEMANVQLRYPEIVMGYIMIIGVNEKKGEVLKDAARYFDRFHDAIKQLTGRDAPSWAAGTVEASAIISVDFHTQPRAQILHMPNVDDFFDHIAVKLSERNPDLQIKDRRK